MKKIFVDKDDTAPIIVEKMIAEPEAELALIVPKSSALKDAPGHFEILKREAEALGKTLFVESVDESILALATTAKIGSLHPLFRETNASRSLSDIVPAGGARGRINPAKPPKKNMPKKEARPKPETMPQDTPRPVVHRGSPPVAETKFFKDVSLSDPSEKPKKRKLPHIPRNILVGSAAAILIFAGAAWGLGAIFGRTQVMIHFKKIPWQYEGAANASTALASADPKTGTFPAEVFREKKNITKLYPATGTATVNQKATGRITIYNNYSAAPQSLVATTRFMAPNGKIFRLDQGVVVPGETTQDGVRVPATIDAAVTADAGGPGYNLSSSSEHFSIPGFAGTPKHPGFYGILSGGASGGYAGVKAVPNDADVAAAKKKTTELLTAALQSKLVSSRPANLVIPDGASDTRVTKLAANTTTDANGNFSVFGEVEFRAIGFRESDIKTYLQTMASHNAPDTAFNALTIRYNNVKPNFDRGQLAFSLQAQGTLSPIFSESEFKSRIAGLDIDAARRLILSLPDLSDAKISVWPVWLGVVPKNLKKINVAAE